MCDTSMSWSMSLALLELELRKYPTYYGTWALSHARGFGRSKTMWLYNACDSLALTLLILKLRNGLLHT